MELKKSTDKICSSSTDKKVIKHKNNEHVNSNHTASTTVNVDSLSLKMETNLNIKNSSSLSESLDNEVQINNNENDSSDSNNLEPGSNNNNTSSNNKHKNDHLKMSSNTNGNNASKFGIPVPNRVFVGSIPDDTSVDEVRKLFSLYGNINSVKIITDCDGVSKGYGFVTFEKEEDARKALKESDKLIIKNRKLNVSPAVIKHPNYPIDSRMMHGGSVIYSTLPYSNVVNYNQYYDNGYCAAEGLPLYQIAGMNGHFVSNCPSLLASPIAQQYFSPTSTNNALPAYSATYQSANYIYPSVSPGNSLLSVPPNQPLLPGATTIPHAFQYSPACNGITLANPNNNMHYSLIPNHPNSNQSSSQYLQFSNMTPALNQSMHLQTAPVADMHNSNGASTQTAVQLNGNDASTPVGSSPLIPLSPPTHGNQLTTPIYSNMAASHIATQNSLPNVNISSEASNMETILDNSSEMGNLLNQSVTGGYLPNHILVNDNLIWSPTHVPISNSYCGNTNNNVVNCKSYSTPNNDRLTVLSHNSGSYISKSSQLHHSSNSVANNNNNNNNNNSSTNPKANTFNGSTSNNNHHINSSTKEKNFRYNNSSYGSSHKKIYNGGQPNQVNKMNKYANGTSANTLINHGGNSADSVPEMAFNNERNNSFKMQYSNSYYNSRYNQHYSYPNSLLNNNNNNLNSSNNSLITKTINGVEIYALPNNNKSNNNNNNFKSANTTANTNGNAYFKNHSSNSFKNSNNTLDNNNNTSSNNTSAKSYKL